MDNESTKISGMERILVEELKASLVNDRLPCAVAFKISRKLKVSPRKVGDMANKLNVKISNCQLCRFSG